MVKTKLANTLTDRPYIAQIADLDAAQPGDDSSPGRPIPKIAKPCRENSRLANLKHVYLTTLLRWNLSTRIHT
jgi:hypothetical protein